MVDYHGRDVVTVKPDARAAWAVLPLVAFVLACDPLLPPGVTGTDPNSFAGCAQSLIKEGAQTLCLSSEGDEGSGPMGTRRSVLIGIESEQSCTVTRPVLELPLGTGNSTLIGDRLYQCTSGEVRETSLTTGAIRTAALSCSKLTADNSDLLVIASAVTGDRVTRYRSFDALLDGRAQSMLELNETTNASFVVIDDSLLSLTANELSTFDKNTGSPKRTFEMTLEAPFAGVAGAGRFLAVLQGTQTTMFRIALFNPLQNFAPAGEIGFSGNFKKLTGLTCIDKGAF